MIKIYNKHKMRINKYKINKLMMNSMNLDNKFNNKTLKFKQVKLTNKAKMTKIYNNSR